MVINDGSTDKTVEVARQFGVEHFINHARNRGLAMSLRDGIRGALELGADIIVLTERGQPTVPPGSYTRPNQTDFS